MSVTSSSRAFEKMGASAATAEENACRVEHVISDEMFAVIRAFAEN